MVFIQQTVYLKYINIDKYKLIGTNWILLYVNRKNASASSNANYFSKFAIEHIKKKKTEKEKKNSTTTTCFDNAWMLFYCIYRFYV